MDDSSIMCRLFKQARFLTRPTLAATSPACPESAKTASRPRTRLVPSKAAAPRLTLVSHFTPHVSRFLGAKRERRWQPFSASCSTRGPSRGRGSSQREEPLLCCRFRKKRNLPLPLLDNYLNAAVLGTPCCRVVAGDRVAVPMAFGREVAAHAAVPQRLSGTIGTSVRELLVG